MSHQGNNLGEGLSSSQRIQSAYSKFHQERGHWNGRWWSKANYSLRVKKNIKGQMRKKIEIKKISKRKKKKRERRRVKAVYPP